jgi:DNA invertase Pin-like site-specific DNA recombinase
MAEGTFIAYYRVSTKRQGESGLGLEAQRAAVHHYLNGGDWTLQEEYTEVESGKSVRNRPVLQQALETCKREKATLVIAKLDRLARNVAFISNLIESKVRFVAADMPDADKTMLQIYAVMAERERDMISKRTKDALGAAKARGVKLGRAEENKAESLDFAKSIKPVITTLQAQGYASIRKLCDELNRQKIATAYNKGQWHIRTVNKLLKQIATL